MLALSPVAGDNPAAGQVIQPGDLVVFFEGKEALGCDRMKEKGIWQCRFGPFHHDEMVGKPYGCRVSERGIGSRQNGWLTTGHCSTTVVFVQRWLLITPTCYVPSNTLTTATLNGLLNCSESVLNMMYGSVTYVV